MNKIEEERTKTEAPVVETEAEETDAIDSTEIEKETEAEEPVAESTAKEVEGETPRERALRQELARVRKQNREARRLAPLEVKETEEEVEEQPQISSPEAAVYNAFQDEALEEFLEANPFYEEDNEAWGEFLKEFQDRTPLVEWARRQKRPLTKRLIKERLQSIHRSLGGDAQTAKEEGKKELLKAQSAAAIMSAGSSTSGRAPVASEKARPLFKRQDNTLNSWVTKKK